MSLLGLGMMSAAAALKEQQAQEVRDREKQRFGWETKRNEADLSLLDQKTDAERERLTLSAAQSRAGQDTLPGQTANTMTEQRLKAGDLAGQERRQPIVQETADANAQAGLSNAKVAGAKAKFNEGQIADQLESMAVQGQLDQEGQRDAVMSRLATAFDDNDPKRALEFFNAVSAKSKLIPETNGKRAVDVQVTDGSDKLNTGPGYRIVFEDGTNMFLTHQTMKGARDRMSAKPEFQFLQDNDTGRVVAANKRTGKVAVAVEGDPRATRNSGKSGPLERDVNYLVTQHGMTQQEALAHLNAAKTMSRQNFILKAAQDAQAMGQKVTEANIAEYGAMYDRASGRPAAAQPAQPAQPTRSGPANPAIQRLITRPGAGLSQAPTTAPPAPAARPSAPPPAQQPAQQSAQQGGQAQQSDLMQRLAKAVQADSQYPNSRGSNVTMLAQEVSAALPGMRQQLQTLSSSLPLAEGSQKLSMEKAIARIQNDVKVAEAIMAQARSVSNASGRSQIPR